MGEAKPIRLLNLNEVKRKTSLSHSTIYRWMKDKKFPKPLALGEGCVRWREEDLDRWIEEKAAAA